MDQTPTPSPVAFSVEIGPDGALQLHVRANGRDIPVAIDPSQAAVLGQALLAASALCAPGRPQPQAGARIEGAHLPLDGWRVGGLNDGSWQLLGLRLRGGAELSIRMTPRDAEACGRKLCAVAADLSEGKDDVPTGGQA